MVIRTYLYLITQLIFEQYNILFNKVRGYFQLYAYST